MHMYIKHSYIKHKLSVFINALIVVRNAFFSRLYRLESSVVERPRLREMAGFDPRRRLTKDV